MRKIPKFLISILVLGALAYQFQGEIRNFFLSFFPCSQPIPYALGTFDNKFGISKSYFLSALTDAEKIWEKPFGKELFSYKPADLSSDVLKINLIYDFRQQATAKLASLGISVKDTRASYDILKAKFTTLKAEYEKEKIIFETRLKTFNHTKGEVKELQAMQASLNAKADEINALVVALNRLIDSLNLSVDKYNTTNQARGESFEEGIYSSNGLNREIDIYEFSNRQKLVRVLAHELGHALGLEHVDDPKAIMYKFNQGNNETLTQADLATLKTKCGVE